MVRIFLFLGFLAPVFAALPFVGEMRGQDIISNPTNSEELLGSFSLTGDSTKIPFRLQIVFEDCDGLKDSHGKKLPLTVLKLKYFDTQTSGYKVKDLKSAHKGWNCNYNVEFYEDVQEKYNMELWASWDRQKASAGFFQGKVYINVFPKSEETKWKRHLK